MSREADINSKDSSVLLIEVQLDIPEHEKLISEAYDYQWGQSKKRSSWMLAAGVITVLVAGSALTQQSEVFSIVHFILIGGAAYLFMGYNYLNQIKKGKTQYIESEMKRLSQRTKTINSAIFEFSDSVFKYEDDEISITMKWSAFSHYVDTGDNIFLFYENGQLHPLRKSYFGKDKAIEVVKIINRNLKKLESSESIESSQESEELLDN